MDQKTNHKQKMVAPILITVFLVLYYLIYFMFLIKAINTAASILLGIIPIVLGSLSIHVCIQRIKEIRSGEEDDLSQY